MKESVAVTKETDSKKDFSPTKSGNGIQRLRNEPERQLGSLRSVIDTIRRDGGTPSVDSIATELSSMHTAQRASALLALQQTHGNQYVQRVVTGIQAKLKISQPEDVYELEADRVAEQVMNMPKPQVQRQVEEEELKKKKKEEEKVELIMAKGILGKTPEVSDDFQARFNQSGGGQPLPVETKLFMEERFGVDFSTVRVHTDSHAVQMARDLNAEAFTYERDIYFGAGRYNPQASSGKRLLAHELTHVIQQEIASLDPVTFYLQRESEAGIDPWKKKVVKAIEEMSADTNNSWVPGRIWGLLRLMVKTGHFGVVYPSSHRLRRFKSGDKYGGDIIMQWSRTATGKYLLEGYKEFSTSPEYWREKMKYDDNMAKNAAIVAKSWNNRMFKTLRSGLYTTDEARKLIEEAAYRYYLYAVLKAMVGAAASFYPRL